MKNTIHARMGFSRGATVETFCGIITTKRKTAVLPSEVTCLTCSAKFAAWRSEVDEWLERAAERQRRGEQ